MWNAAAEITQWFDWEALGAIGSVGALLAVVWQLGQQRRENLELQVARLRYVAIILHGAKGLIDMCEKNLEDQVQLVDLGKAMQDAGGFHQLINEYGALTGANMPTGEAVGAFMSGRLSLNSAQRYLVLMAGGDPIAWKDIKRQRDEIEQTLERLSRERAHFERKLAPIRSLFWSKTSAI